MKKFLIFAFILSLLTSCSHKPTEYFKDEVFASFSFVDTTLKNIDEVSIYEGLNIEPTKTFNFNNLEKDFEYIFNNVVFYYLPFTKVGGLHEFLVLKQDSDNSFVYRFCKNWSKNTYYKSFNYLNDKNEVVNEVKYYVEIYNNNLFEYKDSSLKDKDYTYIAVFNNVFF